MVEIELPTTEDTTTAVPTFKKDPPAHETQVERSLRASEIRCRRLFESALDGILVLDAKTFEITDVNPCLRYLLGYPRKHFIGKMLWDIGFFDDQKASKAAFRALRKSGTLRYDDLSIETSSGELREVEFVATAYDAGEKGVIQCNILDVTASRQATRSHIRLLAIEQASEDAIVGKDLTGVITSWNAAAERMFGYLREEVIGKSISILIPAAKEHEEPLFLSRIAVGHTINHFETVRLKQDGTEIDVSITITPITDANGKVIGANKIARDITELKKTMKEIRVLNSALENRVEERTAELNAVNKELEAFSYSVSHDLRAPLRHINGFSQALLEDYSEQVDDVGKDYLNQICDASREMAQLIDEVLELARITRSEMLREKLNMTEIARSVVDQLSKIDPERKVTVTIEDGLTAYGDKRLIGVAVGNLLGNAWKFTSHVKKAKIAFGVDVTEGTPEFFVRDNGAGFDMEYAEKLFGAFQRLHSTAEFEGSGIGLATVQRIVHRHVGEVRAEAAVGKGATFYFTLPVLKETANEE
ncbi:MAG: PAS domain S-box protein, partial [Pyrinomonadaceae bacterium]